MPFVLPTPALVALFAALLALPAEAQVNSDASPLKVSYGGNGSIGPDGPWWFISQAIDFPNQWVQMLPAISELDLVINSDACEDQSTLCPLPLPTMWEESGAWLASGGNDSISPDKGPEEWDSSMASLLNLEGSGRFHQQRMTLYDIDDEDGTAMYCDTDGLMLSDDYAVTYLGGQKYMLDTGFLSLYGAEDTISWTVEDGTDITYNRTLPLAYLNGYVPSISYGLQVGSVDMNVSGSLVLGGYDSSRVLSEPVVVDGDGTFALKRVGMDSAGLYSSGGDYMYYGTPKPNNNQLSAESLDVAVNPGAPYLYLPRQTCDNIAKFLPVVYNANFNLYFWDTEDTAYTDILTSLHHLTFGFATVNDRTAQIKVPMALLNLTLTTPLVSKPTQYFPCSPIRGDQKPTLGRAFLQAAFLAQNWQAEKSFLAQAPGPDHLPEFLKTINADDVILEPATNPPDWASTWKASLPPWDEKAAGGSSSGGQKPADETSASDGNNPDDTALPGFSTPNKAQTDGITGGAISGIVVGVIIVLVILGGLAVWFFRRRKHRKHASQSWTKPANELDGGFRGEVYGSAGAHRKERGEVYEAEALRRGRRWIRRGRRLGSWMGRVIGRGRLDRLEIIVTLSSALMMFMFMLEIC